MLLSPARFITMNMLWALNCPYKVLEADIMALVTSKQP